MTERLVRFEAMLREATAGPWRWDGNLVTKEIYLVSQSRGRPYVMDFDRWGMRGAAPRFQVRQSDGFGVMTRADELAVKEREYRGDIERIEHPDAALIATAPDIIAELIAMVLEQEAEIARLRASARGGPCETCKHKRPEFTCDRTSHDDGGYGSTPCCDLGGGCWAWESR